MSNHKHNPAHACGTCADCGEEMVWNVPRMGPAGGFVHKGTGRYECGGSQRVEAIPSCAGARGSANLVVKKTKHGYEINCPKGLWGVSGPDVRSVISEALHYYRQYAADGEYEDSPNGGSERRMPEEKL